MSRLRELGFESYEAYLRSAHWASVKKQFRESNRSQNCCVCGSGAKIHIHHRTYHALGAEELDHLIAICEEHHNELHRRLRGTGRSLWDAHETLFDGKVVKQRKKKKRLAVRRGCCRTCGTQVGRKARQAFPGGGGVYCSAACKNSKPRRQKVKAASQAKPGHNGNKYLAHRRAASKSERRLRKARAA